ncbi:MAG: helix-turn-helix transcriptional regulator [Clostridia bacterium]|nr:helix-turn-helix transcriptional regulator [Clostridia bacterium]
MIGRELKKIGNKSYVVEQFDESVIENNPYAAVWFVPPKGFHQSAFFKITYIEDGEADVNFFSRCGGVIKKVPVKAKDAFIITPKDIHNYRVNPKFKYCHKDLYLSEELMRKCCDLISDDLYECITADEYPEIFRLSTSAISSVSEMMTPIMFEPTSKVNSAIHTSIVIYILGQYVAIKEHFNNYPKWIKKLLRNLDKESFLTLPIEEIVKETGFSHSYVSSQFKRYMGMSLKKYVNKSKLLVAAAMLSSSDCSIEDIVERLDFNTASNFINLFKAEFGITPGRYRKARQGQAE